MDISIMTHPQFGEVRTTFDENGTILFRASDVAKALGYSDVQKAVRIHCRGVAILSTPSNGGNQPTSFIYEPDLYRLVAKSKLPLAEKFEKWIFEQVLPTIRQNGFYATKSILENPDFIIEYGMKLKQEQEDKYRLEEELCCLQEVMADYVPKISYLESILNSVCCLTTTQIGADYGISAIKLNRILHDERVQWRVGNQWVLYVDHMDNGLTESETILVNNGLRSVVSTKWTQKGRLLIHDILTKRGIYPL